MNVHLIAIGGSAMHNLAIALARKGFQVTGSDDEIYEPSRTRLEREGLLPPSLGWHPDRIHNGLDAVIVGMHARSDNPELRRANELGLRTYSYPEYIYEQTRSKRRAVIGGSHGKTTITAMILHVLALAEMDADYMVGAQLPGFDCMVKLTDAASCAILEGDEYLSSPEDLRPKFHLYHPDIALISGIAWDHINVFPTWENYVDQFRRFIHLITPSGVLVYCQEDGEVNRLAGEARSDIRLIPYSTHAHVIRGGVTVLQTPGGEVPIRVFGRHNLQNLSGARAVCLELGITEDTFYEAIASFGGAARRLELLREIPGCAVYRDFAHSPSKLKATTRALSEQYPQRRLVACMELHTFSSLSADFLREYHGAMDSAHVACVYFNPKTIAHKRLAPISEAQVKEAFGRDDLEVFTSSSDLVRRLNGMDWKDCNLLLMTSGNFDGVDFQQLAAEITRTPDMA